MAPELYQVPAKWPRDKPLPEDRRVADALLQLFDLSQDPAEERDLAPAQGEAVTELIRLWGALRPVGQRKRQSPVPPDAAGGLGLRRERAKLTWPTP